MDTIKVRKYLQQLPSSWVYNIGVFASDNLPSVISPSTAIIANTDPHTATGEHWIAMYLDRDADKLTIQAHLEYFDSFGKPPYYTNFQQFLRRNSRHYPFKWNKYRLQGYNTSVCGHYCLTYLYCRARYGMTMNDFVQLFHVDSNSRFNDDYIMTLFHKFYFPIV